MTEPDLLNIIRGDREVIDIALTGLVTGQLTGIATAKFTARWRTDSTDAVLAYSTGTGVTIDSANTKLTVVIAPTDTSWLPNQRLGLVYDVEVSPNDGSGPVTVVSGRLLVNPSVS